MAQNRYEPEWSSLVQHPTPQWFRDAKFGIYTHWGVYCVPASGPNATWYPYNMYREGTPAVRVPRQDLRRTREVRLQGLHPDVHRRASSTPTNGPSCSRRRAHSMPGRSASTTTASPCGTPSTVTGRRPGWDRGRDVVGDLENAIRRQGMRFMVALHHAENWWFYPHWRKEFDTSDPRYAGLYGEPHNLDGRINHKDFFEQDTPQQAVSSRPGRARPWK